MSNDATEEATINAIEEHVTTYAQICKYDLEDPKIIDTKTHTRLTLEVRCKTSKIIVVVVKNKSLYNLYSYGYVRVSLVLNPRDSQVKHRHKVTPDSFKTLIENAFDEFDDDLLDDDDGY